MNSWTNSWTKWVFTLFTQTYYYIGGEHIIDEIKHYTIMKKIRNGLELNHEEFAFIKTLSKPQLIEIIEINNTNIERMNELIHYTEK
jgi:hypothetical protein